LVLEQGEGIVVRRGDADRLGPDQSAAAGPTADQGERTVVVADEQRRRFGLEPPRKGEADGTRGGARDGRRSSGGVRDGASSVR
jgi:hypothetical protein